ncbi:hypothetical protein VPH35_084385 [Triticum aestivum]|uniref:NB-ARC domain-containing protein n=1 Tax=Triticum aestivum TaxID=4565 RepID=A0A3B6KK18_WHEAT
MLANSPNISREWMNLQEHLGSGLPSEIDIMRVISLSYDRLPYHVKSCLLYMSLFPKNYQIRRARLLRRWMAEGYIKILYGLTVDEVACSLYDELIKRNMIQPSDTAIASMSSERCCVHGLVLHIILSKYIDENQHFIMDKHCKRSPPSNTRHLVVKTWKRHEKIMTGVNLRIIRSLTFFGEYPMSLVTPKLRMLRVLDLEDTIGLENNDLRYIGQLPHLRYLGLRGTHISRFPSLRKLSCLETLDVRDTKVTHLPAGVIDKEKLCYLRGGVSFAQDLAEKIREKKNACRCKKNILETLADMLCVRGGGCDERCESPCSCYAGQFSVRAATNGVNLRVRVKAGAYCTRQRSGKEAEDVDQPASAGVGF